VRRGGEVRENTEGLEWQEDSQQQTTGESHIIQDNKVAHSGGLNGSEGQEQRRGDFVKSGQREQMTQQNDNREILGGELTGTLSRQGRLQLKDPDRSQSGTTSSGGLEDKRSKRAHSVGKAVKTVAERYREGRDL